MPLLSTISDERIVPTTTGDAYLASADGRSAREETKVHPESTETNNGKMTKLQILVIVFFDIQH